MALTQGGIMTDYHEYSVQVDDGSGRQQDYTLHVHEEHHRAHGFNLQGELKNVQALVSIAAGALSIAPAAIRGFKYAGKVIRKAR
jgi:hypothetical protein